MRAPRVLVLHAVSHAGFQAVARVLVIPVAQLGAETVVLVRSWCLAVFVPKPLLSTCHKYQHPGSFQSTPGLLGGNCSGRLLIRGVVSESTVARDGALTSHGGILPTSDGRGPHHNHVAQVRPKGSSQWSAGARRPSMICHPSGVAGSCQALDSLTIAGSLRNFHYAPSATGGGSVVNM